MPQIYLADIISAYNENRENDTCNTDYNVISVEDLEILFD